MGMFASSNFPEGEIFLRWINSRFDKNKNFIGVTTGPTGSGKSYLDLRKAEMQHKRRFNEEFPIENCCFSVAELMERVSSGKLRSGEVLILEEAGVNIGSGDWQNKVVKMFNYVLQSFRSMNIGMFLNLPVLSMLSKQARQLVHMHMETTGIDFELGVCKVKPLVHQLNQHSGKSYWKYMRVKVNKRVVKVERMGFGLPSPELIAKYEAKKEKFLAEITTEFTQQLRKLEREKIDKLARKEPTPVQKEVLELWHKGLNKTQIAKEVGKAVPTIWKILKTVEKNGFSLEK
jgi:hypothetical protein